MGITIGGDSMVDKVDEPKKVNPINEEVVLTPELEEHKILSKEMVANKRPWCDTLTNDMYKDSIPEIDGSKVYVDFFSTIVTDTTIPSNNSNMVGATVREFIALKDYPIFLDGGVETDTNSKDQKTTTNSTAIICGVLPPQTSDYFVLNTGINRDSLFSILSVKPLSIYTGKAYQIEYRMEEAYRGPKYDNIKNKVTRKLSYIREHHQMGEKYLLTDDEVRVTLENKITSDSLWAAYKAEFYLHDLKVFGVYTEDGIHTDMPLQEFLTKIYVRPDDVFYYPEYGETAVLDTVYDALLYMDSSRLMNVMTDVYYYRLISPTDISQINPVLVSPITSMPFQKGSKIMNVRPPHVAVSVIHQSGGVELPEIHVRDIFDGCTVSNIKEFPNVLQNDNYLFSSAFYRGVGDNELEELLLTAINRNPIDRDRVLALVSKVQLLGKQERFFIMPFLLVLLRLKEV